MGLTPSFPDGGVGVTRKSLSNLIKTHLETTYDPSKTFMNIRYDGSKKEIYFDSSNNDFPASQTKNRPIVVRVNSGRRLIRDLEIGLFNIRFSARPTIHVFAYDPNATTAGEVSDLLEDMVQYITRWVAEDPYRLQPDGIHCITMLEDQYISNNGDPNWHHWMMTLDVEYEMIRFVDTDLPEFVPSEFVESEFV